MRTTLIIPDKLMNEAKKLLGFKSKTDIVIHSLEELIRRRQREDLVGLMGKVSLNLDLKKSRSR